MPCKNKKKLAKYWKKAKLSGLAQIPTSEKTTTESKLIKYPKKKLAKLWKGKKIKHGICKIKKTAQLSNIGMKEYSIVDVCFLREGTFRTNGVEYYYPWEVIEKNAKSWEGQPFFINHSDTNGTEMGIIESTYIDVIDGVKWLCAKVKIPEVSFTQNFLDRIQNGLIRFVSSTHSFFADKLSNNKINEIDGYGISTVDKGEVDGAKIIKLQRNANKQENI